jgi:hypothetical protein
MTLQHQSVAKVADAGTDKAVIQDILLAQKTMISRLDELTEVSNLMVNAQAGTAVAARLDKHDEALTQMKEEQAKTNLLLTGLLDKLTTAKTEAAVSTTAFRSQVVKPGRTTPAAIGGPNGSSGRP